MIASALRRAAERLHLADACIIVLRLSGWSAVTLLAAAGCLVLLFAMLGGFTAEGFFAHLDNLASRFAAADLARREHFLSLARIAGAILVSGVAACRWRSFARSLNLSEENARV